MPGPYTTPTPPPPNWDQLDDKTLAENVAHNSPGTLERALAFRLLGALARIDKLERELSPAPVDPRTYVESAIQSTRVLDVSRG